MSKVLGLMFALAFGLALEAASPGGPSKVTADTGKAAAPLDEEASSLAFAKVSAFAEGAASEVVGQTSEVKSEDQPQGSHEASQDQKLIIPSLIPTVFWVVVKFGYRVNRPLGPLGPIVLTNVRPISWVIRRVKFFTFNS